MIITPKIKNTVALNCYPQGCREAVKRQIIYVKQQVKKEPRREGGPKRVLILGASSGLGLASRIVARFAAGAATLGVSFERAPSEDRSASAGWYNNLYFERMAEGQYAKKLLVTLFQMLYAAKFLRRLMPILMVR